MQIYCPQFGRQLNHRRHPAEILRSLGHTYRSAAPLLGVHFTHLHKVLTRQRHSASLLSRIESLPARDASDSRSNPQP